MGSSAHLRCIRTLCGIGAAVGSDARHRSSHRICRQTTGHPAPAGKLEPGESSPSRREARRRVKTTQAYTAAARRQLLLRATKSAVSLEMCLSVSVRSQSVTERNASCLQCLSRTA